jgi:hypothetical protein
MEQKENRENGRPSASEMTCYDVGAKMVQEVDVAVVGGFGASSGAQWHYRSVVSRPRCWNVVEASAGAEALRGE